MNTENNAWAEIRQSLIATQDPALEALIDSAQLSYDGAYTLSADLTTYTALCQVYPWLETIVQDHTGKHLRLSLNETVPMGTVSSSLKMSLGASNISDAILVPESIIAIPSYLFRFVPYVGSSPVLIATALRQAFYRASRDHGADQLYPRSGDTVSIQVEALLSILGNTISRAKFFRIFKDGSMDWFVTRGEASHRVKNGQVQRLPTRYHYRGLLLTPGDASDLYTWLLDNQLSRDPIEVLSQVCQTSRDQILSFPFRVPLDSDYFNEAVSVVQVVQAALQRTGLNLNPTLASLCDNLSAHLIRPESFLAIPHYWFQNVLPELGDDLGMLYLMSKNCCFIDWARGKDRNTFWVTGGLSTLQGWIRSETLPRRIPIEVASKRGRPRSNQVKQQSAYTRAWRENQRELASACLTRVQTRPTESVPSAADWQLRVSEITLTARDEALKQAIYAFLFAPPEPLSQATLLAYFESQPLQNILMAAAQRDPARLCHFEILVREGICQIETLTSQEISHFETFVDGFNYYFETLIEAGICQFDTILNILNRLKIPSFFNKNIPPALNMTVKEQMVGGHSKVEAWDFNRLLSNINPLLKEQIITRKLEPAYLSWLIYASLTPTIQTPVSLAVKRTLETGVDAGGPALRLARLPAGQLTETLISVLARLEQGYMGRSMWNGAGADDLRNMLPPDCSQQALRHLLTRLTSALGL